MTCEALLELAEPTEDLIEILGRPNFTCIRIARLLSKSGHTIPPKAEAEQAHVILFLLQHWLRDREGWAENAEADLRARAAAVVEEPADG